ncbi:MAG: type II toxin-antitoxin system RelE/ParE family toxin [Deltaproteobacteria bacterium]|nr:type II toxin-antitoxin system RelE/ParE family toxin [Deltaproteobacteria bacterium]
MILSLKNVGTQDIFNDKNTRRVRRICPEQLWKLARRKLDQLDSAGKTEDLLIPPGNKLEVLTGNCKDQHSIRINRQYRICFVWSAKGPSEVEIVDYHKG